MTAKVQTDLLNMIKEGKGNREGFGYGKGDRRGQGRNGQSMVAKSGSIIKNKAQAAGKGDIILTLDLNSNHAKYSEKS